MKYLPPAMKLWQGNVFTPVCQSFCSQGVCVCLRSRGCLPHHSRQTPPWADTPTPWADIPQADIPTPWADTPQPDTPTPWADTPQADTPCPVHSGIHTPPVTRMHTCCIDFVTFSEFAEFLFHLGKTPLIRAWLGDSVSFL